MRPFVALQVAVFDCGSVRMARRRPSTQFCSASSQSPSSSRSSSSGPFFGASSRAPQRASRTRRAKPPAVALRRCLPWAGTVSFPLLGSTAEARPIPSTGLGRTHLLVGCPLRPRTPQAVWARSSRGGEIRNGDRASPTIGGAWHMPDILMRPFVATAGRSARAAGA